jgi:hypothetical protein
MRGQAFLSIEDIATFMNVSTKTVRRMLRRTDARNAGLKPVLVGRRLGVPRAGLCAYLGCKPDERCAVNGTPTCEALLRFRS